MPPGVHGELCYATMCSIASSSIGPCSCARERQVKKSRAWPSAGLMRILRLSRPAQARTVQVRRTLTRDGGKHTVGPAKTAKGRRTVKLTIDATEALQEHLERQLVEIDKAGDNWQENGLVFCAGRGTLINPTNLRRRSLASLLQRACLPPMTFHQLRHTAATI